MTNYAKKAWKEAYSLGRKRARANPNMAAVQLTVYTGGREIELLNLGEVEINETNLTAPDYVSCRKCFHKVLNDIPYYHGHNLTTVKRLRFNREFETQLGFKLP